MKQSLATTPDIVYKLKESEIARQLFLRNATMWTQPRTQQRPKSFHRVDMNFMKAVSIFIASIFTRRMIDAFMLVAPLLQTIIDIVFIGVNQAARLNHFGEDRLNGSLLNIRQHLNGHFAIALHHAQNRRLFFCQRAPSTFSFEFSPSSFAFLAGHDGWIPFMTSHNVNFVGFN